MKFVDFYDETIPVGKRKVAYVKYAMMHGTPKKKAMQQANKKFGFGRRGTYLVFIINADSMDLPSFSGYTWEEACGINCERAESVIVVPDMYYEPMELVRPGLPECFGMDRSDIREWAEKNGYKVKYQCLTP